MPPRPPISPRDADVDADVDANGRGRRRYPSSARARDGDHVQHADRSLSHDHHDRLPQSPQPPPPQPPSLPTGLPPHEPPPAPAPAPRSRSRSARRGRHYDSRSPTRSRSPRSRSRESFVRDRSYSRGRGRTGGSRSRSYSRGRGYGRDRDDYDDRRRSESPPGRHVTKVVVERLSRNITEDHLYEIFGQFGEIRDLDLPMNRTHQTNRGTAFILYNHEEDAEAAITHMNEAIVDGAIITVSIVIPQRRMMPAPPIARGLPPHKLGGRGGAGGGSRNLPARPFGSLGWGPNSGRRSDMSPPPPPGRHGPPRHGPDMYSPDRPDSRSRSRSAGRPPGSRAVAGAGVTKRYHSRTRSIGSRSRSGSPGKRHGRGGGGAGAGSGGRGGGVGGGLAGGQGGHPRREDLDGGRRRRSPSPDGHLGHSPARNSRGRGYRE